jgi:hypothetical protein
VLAAVKPLNTVDSFAEGAESQQESPSGPGWRGLHKPPGEWRMRTAWRACFIAIRTGFFARRIA